MHILIIRVLDTSSLKKELNMQQRRWLKLVKDYDYDIRYYLAKVNMVADVFSIKVFLS